MACFSCKKNNEANTVQNHTNQIDLNIPFEPLDKEAIDNYQKQINIYFNEKMPDYNGSFLVFKNGTILFESYNGVSNHLLGDSIKINTPIHLASVSKPLTATAILRLVAQNKLTLDTKVQEVLSDFPYQNVTIKDLLNHRSGVPNYLYLESEIQPWDDTKVFTNQDIIKLFAKHQVPVIKEPNKGFYYNNSNYLVLALVLENITDKKFPEAMKELIFEPLGMKNTFVFDFFTQKDKVSQSYKSTLKIVDWDQYDAIYGDKNIYSTPRDLLNFHLSFYTDFLPKHLKEQQIQGYSYENKGVKNYGLGFRMREHTDKKIIFHNGWWHGNKTSMIHMPSDSLFIVALSNKFSKKSYQINQLLDLFLKGTLQSSSKENLDNSDDSNDDEEDDKVDVPIQKVDENEQSNPTLKKNQTRSKYF